MSGGLPHVAFASEDEAAVRGVVSAYADSWNRHDMKAMHELNVQDVDWINVAGNHWRSNANVYKGHDAIHRTIFANTRMGVDETQVRAIAPGVAVAVATMRFGPVTTPSGQELSEIRTRGSFVLVKRDDEWKIAHFQNTTIHPDAERNDPITWESPGGPPRRETP